MKRIHKIFIIFILLIIPNSVFGASIKPSQSSIYKYSDYVIDSYDINIVVNENNTFDITENITAYFNTSKHGIYRKIPLKNIVNRLDAKIEEKVPGYKETISTGAKESFGFLISKLKQGISYLDTKAEEKIGTEKYEEMINEIQQAEQYPSVVLVNIHQMLRLGILLRILVNLGIML